MNNKRDVKFIIYQALYIFVICVIAIKGASLDLNEVEIKKMVEPGWTYLDTTNKTLVDRNEFSKMILFDSTRYMIVSIDDIRNHPEKYPTDPIVQSAGSFVTSEPPNSNTTNNPLSPPVTQKNTDPTKTMVLGSMQLVQYHDNSVTNKNSYPITIKGVTIPANSTKTVRIDNDNSVIISSEGGSMTVATIQNKRPEISFQKLTDMGENTSAKQLQRTTGFRVKIQDDYPEQLDVKITGSVSVKKVDNLTYDVTMNLFPNEQAFDTYTENRSSPYQVGFSVIVTDKIAPHSVNRQQAFVFGQW